MSKATEELVADDDNRRDIREAFDETWYKCGHNFLSALMAPIF